MKKEFFYLTVLLSLLAVACKKDTGPDVVVLKFWDVCGNCLDSDITFSLAENGLFDQDNQLMPDSLFQLAKQLNLARPAILCDSLTSVYGCGSCYDATDYYLQTKCNGLERTWQFDPYDNTQPAEVQEFARLLQDLYRKCTE